MIFTDLSKQLKLKFFANRNVRGPRSPVYIENWRRLTRRGSKRNKTYLPTHQLTCLRRVVRPTVEVPRISLLELLLEMIPGVDGEQAVTHHCIQTITI